MKSKPDYLDELIESRTKKNSAFPKTVDRKVREREEKRSIIEKMVDERSAKKKIPPGPPIVITVGMERDVYERLRAHVSLHRIMGDMVGTNVADSVLYHMVRAVESGGFRVDLMRIKENAKETGDKRRPETAARTHRRAARGK